MKSKLKINDKVLFLYQGYGTRQELCFMEGNVHHFEPWGVEVSYTLPKYVWNNETEKHDILNGYSEHTTDCTSGQIVHNGVIVTW